MTATTLLKIRTHSAEPSPGAAAIQDRISRQNVLRHATLPFPAHG